MARTPDVSDGASIEDLEAQLGNLGISNEDVAKCGKDRNKLTQARDKILTELDKVPLPPASAGKLLLVIGSCGDGKSTLVNALKDPDAGEPEAKVDEADAGGVTKTIMRYKGKPINGQPVTLLDTPGVGDQTIRPPELLSMIQDTLAGRKQKIDGVIVTVKVSEGRLNLGAQVVQKLVEHSLVSDVGGDKWANIILCGTQQDRASAGEIANFKLPKDVMSRNDPTLPKGTVANFYRNAPSGFGSYVMVDQNNYEPLREAVTKLPSVPVLAQKLQAGQLSEIMAGILGLDAEAMKKDIERIEKDMEEKFQERVKAMEAHMEAERAKADEARKKELDDFRAAQAAELKKTDDKIKKLRATAEKQKQAHVEETKKLKEKAEEDREAFERKHEKDLENMKNESKTAQDQMKADLAKQKADLEADIARQREAADAGIKRFEIEKQRLQDLKAQILTGNLGDDCDYGYMPSPGGGGRVGRKSKGPRRSGCSHPHARNWGNKYGSGAKCLDCGAEVGGFRSR